LINLNFTNLDKNYVNLKARLDLSNRSSKS